MHLYSVAPMTPSLRAGAWGGVGGRAKGNGRARPWQRLVVHAVQALAHRLVGVQRRRSVGEDGSHLHAHRRLLDASHQPCVGDHTEAQADRGDDKRSLNVAIEPQC